MTNRLFSRFSISLNKALLLYLAVYSNCKALSKSFEFSNLIKKSRVILGSTLKFLIPSVFKRVYVLTNPRLNKLIDWLAVFKSIIVRNLVKYYGPGGYLSKLWPTGTMVLWVAILLLASLSLSFIA